MHTNALIKETSPYLLQHAHNPVNWYPWCNEAFEKAEKEQKPVLVSIGYAACHWCHVMERESFENEAIAAIMNEHFINIKVDREERPDVDHIYMEAVQAISGSGGWPLNVFLTPDRKPFYGGTYFPPQRAFNRSSWTEVLLAIADAYKNKKEDILTQAENLTQHLHQANAIGNSGQTFDFSASKINEAFEAIIAGADKQWGGFGKAPKFPQTHTITFLLRYARLTGNKEALKVATLSLDKMLQGGIYDQVGGGLSRYSTDEKWLVPHFEKMLYDNALLVGTLAEAFQYTQKAFYKEKIEEIISFAERELMHQSGGFFSALDADSEGVEGLFYVWDYQQLTEVLGDDVDIFCRYYNCSKEGNWEGKNILHTTTTVESFALQNEMEVEGLNQLLQRGLKKLLAERETRVRPQLDDKVLLGWNALMNTALSKAYAATGIEKFKELAVKNMEFLCSAFADGNNQFYHTWKNGKATQPAFLDDMAYLIEALIQLGQVTHNYRWLVKGSQILTNVVAAFGDTETPYFFFTNQTQEDVLLRKKELYDAATPSGNSVMAENLYHLSIIFDIGEWRKRSSDLLAAFGAIILKYPTSFSKWLNVLQEVLYGTMEIAVLGPNAHNLADEIQQIYIPHKIILSSVNKNDDFPLLKNKEGQRDLIYICKDYACQKPMKSIPELKFQLNNKLF